MRQQMALQIKQTVILGLSKQTVLRQAQADHKR